MINLPKKWPAYGLGLFRRRAAGETPWLVVASVGMPVDWETLRGYFGVARIGFGPRFPYERGDYRMLFGLDVLVNLMGYEGLDEAGRAERDYRALSAIWRHGEPATLWTMKAGYAWRLQPYVRQGRDGEYLEFVNQNVPHELDESFKGEVQQARETQLLLGDGVFAHEQFREARELVLARITQGRQSPAGHDVQFGGR